MQLRAKRFFGAVAGVVFCFSTSATIFATPTTFSFTSSTGSCPFTSATLNGNAGTNSTAFNGYCGSYISGITLTPLGTGAGTMSCQGFTPPYYVVSVTGSNTLSVTGTNPASFTAIFTGSGGTFPYTPPVTNNWVVYKVNWNLPTNFFGVNTITPVVTIKFGSPGQYFYVQQQTLASGGGTGSSGLQTAFPTFIANAPDSPYQASISPAIIYDVLGRSASLYITPTSGVVPTPTNSSQNQLLTFSVSASFTGGTTNTATNPTDTNSGIGTTTNNFGTNAYTGSISTNAFNTNTSVTATTNNLATTNNSIFDANESSNNLVTIGSNTFQETTNSNILQTSTGAHQYSSTPSSNVAGAAIIQTALGPQEISNATNPLNSQSAALFNSQLIAALNSNNSILSSNLTSGFSGLSNAMSANSGSGTNTNSGGTNDVPYLASLSNSVSTATNSSSTNPPLPNTNSLPHSPSLYSSSTITPSSTSLLQVTIPSIAGGLSSLSATQVIDLDPMHNSMLAPIIRGVFNIIILIITGIFLAYVFDQVFESLKGFTQISTTQGISGGVFGGAVSVPSGLIFAGIITTVLVALPTLFSGFTSWQSSPTPSSFSAYGSAISTSSAAGSVAWYLFTNFVPFDFAVTTACNALLFRVFRNSVFSAAAAIKIFIVGA